MDRDNVRALVPVACGTASQSAPGSLVMVSCIDGSAKLSGPAFIRLTSDPGGWLCRGDARSNLIMSAASSS